MTELEGIYEYYAIIPIFVRPSIYFSEKRISPFFDADIGVALTVPFVEPETEDKPYASIYLNPALGISFGRSNIALGYKLWTAKEGRENFENKSRNIHGLSFRFGYMF